MDELRLAYFVTPHGFGHAARACAVMEAMHRLRPEARFEIYTTVPEWFFQASLSQPFGYHSEVTDVGLVQRTALEEDLPATLERLAVWLPFDPAHVAALAGQARALGCRAVACDISPLGIAVAQAAGRPSLLVENFTWDWIYAGYLDRAPGLAQYIGRLRALFAAAEAHVQAEPFCGPRDPRARVTAPISRSPRLGRDEIRARLGLPPDEPAVLVTMGGIPPRYAFLDDLAAGLAGGAWLVIPGASDRPERRGRLRLLPHHSEFHHPDLVAACDAVIGKAGYSTLAEAYAAGLPMGYVPRSGFRESAVLERFLLEQEAGLEIPAPVFESGRWLDCLPALLSLPRRAPPACNGAAEAAEVLLSCV